MTKTEIKSIIEERTEYIATILDIASRAFGTEQIRLLNKAERISDEVAQLKERIGEIN